MQGDGKDEGAVQTAWRECSDGPEREERDAGGAGRSAGDIACAFQWNGEREEEVYGGAAGDNQPVFAGADGEVHRGIVGSGNGSRRGKKGRYAASESGRKLPQEKLDAILEVCRIFADSIAE